VTPESRNSLLAIACCVAFYLLYTQYLNQRYPDLNKPQPAATEAPANQATVQTTPAPASKIETPQVKPAADVKRLTETETRIENEDGVFFFDQNSGGIKSIRLKKYLSEQKDASSQVELLSGDFIFQPSFVQGSIFTGGFHAQRSGNKIEFWREENGWVLRHAFEVPASGFVVKVSSSYENKTPTPQNLKAVQVLRGYVHKDVKTGGMSFLPGSPVVQPRFVATHNTTDDFYEGESFCGEDAKVLSGKATLFDFVGFDNHYFLSVLVPKVPFDYDIRSAGPTVNGNCPVASSLTQDFGMVQPNANASFNFDGYFGPKDLQIITSYNEKLKVTLGLGWLDMIARPLLLAIKGIYKVTHNYGIAIIILTLLLKILFFPLAHQSAVSMAKMKKLNPEMTAIREKYKSDPQRMQRELMGFMAKHKVNPMKGCLPILPQIPVFFALFRVLSASIELRHAPFYGWIHDLSAQDPYLISPLVLGVFMFIQQKMTPMTGMDKTQERIMMFMPIVFTLMMLSLPSGLVLYMLTNTIVSILQQKWLNAKLADK